MLSQFFTSLPDADNFFVTILLTGLVASLITLSLKMIFKKKIKTNQKINDKTD